MKNIIENKIQKTIHSLENRKKIQANHFFYTRLKAKIKTMEEEKTLVTLPAYLRPVVIAIIIAINIFSAIYLFNQNVNKDTKLISSTEENPYFTEQTYYTLLN